MPTIDLDRIDAAAILRVPEAEPERLFGPDPRALATAFRRLAKRWHPDRSAEPDAGMVFRHLNALHQVAEARAAAGDWRTPGKARFTDRLTGRSFDVGFRRMHDTESGEVYVGRTVLAYALPRDQDDLLPAAMDAFRRTTLPKGALADTYAIRMPRLLQRIDADDRTVLVMTKTLDQFLLRDLLAHAGGRMDPRHVAWVVAELLSLCCVHATPGVGLVHAAMGPDTLLVSPMHHSVVVAGGWQYSAPVGGRLRAAPQRVTEHVPPALLSGGEATEAVALDLVRLVAAECLGYVSPMAARRDAAVPQPLRDWLTDMPASTAASDYASWPRVRDRSFGPRQFIRWPVDPEAVYPPL